MQSAGNLKSYYSSKPTNVEDENLEKKLNDYRLDLVKNHIKIENEEKEEILNFVSDHIKNTKELLVEDLHFGYYLAGLIEGDGCFERNRLTICYHEKDVAAAYWLKKRIGFGQVNKVKGKRAFNYHLTKPEGIKYVLTITNGKFVTDYKINQLIKYNYEKKYGVVIQPKNSNPDLKNNYWLSGFMDADGSFLIYILKRPKKRYPETRLKIKIAQKENDILQEIYNTFSGYLAHTKRGEWQYDSISYQVASEFIQYFDSFSLVSTKYIEYIQWRDCYRLVLKKEHLSENGLIKIQKLKDSIERFRS